MTFHNPTLIVRRLIIRRNSLVAYDESFHEGVNVIRGDNSSGKSTIMNFLFYGLGGDLFDWSDVALLCTHVWTEVELNGTPVTVRREIVETSRSGMDIYGGRYADAVKAPIDSWKKYPYARAANLESFSQALFRLLEMPDVALETSGNVTMHQILRVLYADHIKSIDSIFRDESFFDNGDLRETVGNLLCGAYDSEVYSAQQELRAKARKFDEASAELKSIINILGSDQSAGINWVEATRADLVSQRNELIKEIEKAEANWFKSQAQESITLSEQERAYSLVQSIQKELAEKRDELRRIELDIADSTDFIRQIENKMEALRDAEAVAAVILGVQFSSCPACLADVDSSNATISACPLCKTPFDAQRARDRVAGLINDAAIQLKQSTHLQGLRRTKALAAQKDEEALLRRWHDAAKQLEMLQSLPTSKARQESRELSRRLGYIDSQLDEIEQRFRLAQRIDELSSRKQNLAFEIEQTRDQIALLKARQSDRLAKANRAIEQETIELLKRDLERQDSFENPESVTFSFKQDSIQVDEHSYFSASSRVILKCCFMLGFLKAALKDPKFRHPKFLLIDVTENNGMEIQRSYNLQHMIVDVSNSTAIKHQIIYATAFPSPQIDDEFLIGHHATRERMSLSIN